MSWIALQMLTGDKAKFFGIVMGLTFSALLITQQGSIFCGLMLRTAGQVADTTGADLWVMDPNVLHVDDVKPMIQNNLYRVRGVEGVLWAVPLYKGTARAKVDNVEGTPRQVIESGGPARPGRLVDGRSAGEGPDPRSGSSKTSASPDADLHRHTTDSRKLFPGLPPEMYLREKKLPAVPGQRDRDERSPGHHRWGLRGVADVPVQPGRLHHLFPGQGVHRPTSGRPSRISWPRPSPAGTPRTSPSRSAARLGWGPRPGPHFVWKTINYYLKYTGIPINFGITAALGFLVGTAIAGQTFYNFTLENLKQFGALKAMGATNGMIIRMILLQAARRRLPRLRDRRTAWPPSSV